MCYDDTARDDFFCNEEIAQFWLPYSDGVITITVDRAAMTESNRRAGVCNADDVDFTERIGDKSEIQWARNFRPQLWGHATIGAVRAGGERGRANMKRVILICVLSGIPVALPAQTSPKPSFMSAAAIEHTATNGTLTANDPRPLKQAVDAIGQEYGWIVDYEDPQLQSNFDPVDDTGPKWRANHPNEKGVVRAAGGAFHSTFPGPSSISGSDAEDQVLQKLVADYNSSGNPGKFIVREQAGDRYVVTGISRRDNAGNDEAVPAPLDTAISFPTERRDARATLQLIVDSGTAKTRVKIDVVTGPSSNPLRDSAITIGGSEVPARVLLLKALDEISSTSPYFQKTFVWDLIFDADMNAYFLLLRTATKTVTDANGRKIVQFVDHSRN